MEINHIFYFVCKSETKITAFEKILSCLNGKILQRTLATLSQTPGGKEKELFRERLEMKFGWKRSLVKTHKLELCQKPALEEVLNTGDDPLELLVDDHP